MLVEHNRLLWLRGTNVGGVAELRGWVGMGGLGPGHGQSGLRVA